MSTTETTPAAEQRKLIQQLMGNETSSRYGGRNRQHKQPLGMADPRLCKSYLVGECPYDLFQGTKQSMGRCPQLHLPKFKLQYDQDYSKDDCNGQIVVALKKLEHTREERERIKSATKNLDDVDTQLALMTQEIDSLISHNEIAKAMQQSVKLEETVELKKNIALKVKSITENIGQSSQQKLQVCEICGAYLSRLDTDRRLADHFLGKIHLGYVKMREDYSKYDSQSN